MNGYIYAVLHYYEKYPMPYHPCALLVRKEMNGQLQESMRNLHLKYLSLYCKYPHDNYLF